MNNKKSFPLGIKIKEEPGTSDTTVSQRLPSLRPPRDLSLSAFGQKLSPSLMGNQSKNKKVYVPNLNVQRNKFIEDSSKNEVIKGKEKEKERNLKTDKIYGRGKKSLVQMGSGPFSEGFTQNAKSHFGRNTSGNAGGDSEVLQKPKLKLQENIKINKEEEEAMMKDLLRDDIIDDPSLEPDYDNCPVKLPLVDWKVFNTNEDQKMKLKEDTTSGIKVKSEPVEIEDTKPEDNKQHSVLDIVNSSNKESQYIFLQLPNCMPGLKPEMEPLKPGCKTVSSVQSGSTTITSGTEIKVEENRCILNTLSPGCIGKLQILKSGRARLLLGDCKLSVQLGTQVAFKQDLISVNLDSNTHTGEMVNLGPVITRMTVSPDWEDMLLQQIHI